MRIKKENLQVAIDGPSSVGKSTAGLGLAQELGIFYLYSGALYRAVCWLALENNIADDEEKIIELLKEKKLELRKSDKPERHTDVILNGKDITHNLFTRKVIKNIAKIAKNKKIRDYITLILRKMAKNRAVVMDGRDIGTVVLPGADLKVYLTANLQERAKRRAEQLKRIGKPRSLDKVKKEIEKRDKADKSRIVSPLKPAVDAWVLDTTGLSVKKEVGAILEKLKKEDLIE